MSTELMPANGHQVAVRNGDGAPSRYDQRRALVPDNFKEALQMADVMAKSNMFAVKSPEAAAVVLMTGMELGLTPAISMRGIHVINNKPVVSADLMIAICMNSPACEYFILIESTDDHATYETKRVGYPAAVPFTYTWKDATKAGLTNKDVWKQYPAAMLRARCISALARIQYADLMAGLYTQEEVESIPPDPPTTMQGARPYVRENDTPAQKAIEAPAAAKTNSKATKAETPKPDPLRDLQAKVVAVRASASPEVRSSMKTRLDSMGGWEKVRGDKDALAYYHDEYKKAIEESQIAAPVATETEEQDPFAGDAQALVSVEPTTEPAAARGA